MIRGKFALFMLVILTVIVGGIGGLGYAFSRNFPSPVQVVQNFTTDDAPEPSDDKIVAALENGDVALAKKLIRECQTDENRDSEDWNCDLAIAAPLKDKELVTLIEAQGGNPDNALDYAHSAKEAEAVVHLGAKIQTENSDMDNWSHLGTHTLNGNVEVVEWLLNHGAKANEKDADGLTLLAQAEDSAKRATDPSEKANFAKVATLLKVHGATEK